MITAERIKEIRMQAESHTGKASRIILELLDELAVLRRLKLRTGLHAVSVLDPWPYHPHLGKTFAEVPETDLITWRNKQNRDIFMHDICLGIIAARDLRLYDLITKLSTAPKKPVDGKPTSHEEIPAAPTTIAENGNPVAKNDNGAEGEI